MLTAQKTRVRYSPELSLKIGQYASQQRLAYNQSVEHTLAHPNIAKNEIQHQLTLWREKNPERWSGHVATQRPGLFKGRNAVRQADRASLVTLRECRKEVNLRGKPAGKGKPPKHPVRPGRDISPERLYRSRKQAITLTVEDAATIRRLGRHSIYVDGLIIQLSTRVPEKADIRAVQIRERKSSIRRGRNQPLEDRSYNVVLILNVNDPEEKTPWQNPVGLDAGIVHNLTTSDGRHIEQPKAELERPLGRIAQLQERQKRLKRRGRSWTKLQKLVRGEKRKLTNIKDNFEHHTAGTLAGEHSFIIVERLGHTNMRRAARGTAENPGRSVRAKTGLNRSLAYARPGAMQQKLERHSEKNGTWFAKVPPAGTSQICPLCGYRHRKNRKSQAEFRCQNCNLEANADVVAGVNIQAIGMTALALALVLWANGSTKEAAETRRRRGIPPLSDSLTLVLGRPGPKLEPSGCEPSGHGPAKAGPIQGGETGAEGSGPRPMPPEPEITANIQGQKPRVKR